MNNIEAWLKGPIEGVPSLLQPVAHALIQANAEIHAMMEEFPADKLWQKPAGVASAGFHLQHIPGVLDRLFSYSQGLPINNAQLKYLSEEGLENNGITKEMLLDQLTAQVNSAIEHLKTIDPSILTESRTVGRKKLPSTVMGLIFHAAEHTMRHTGQLLVTVKVLTESKA